MSDDETSMTLKLTIKDVETVSDEALCLALIRLRELKEEISHEKSEISKSIEAKLRSHIDHFIKGMIELDMGILRLGDRDDKAADVLKSEVIAELKRRDPGILSYGDTDMVAYATRKVGSTTIDTRKVTFPDIFKWRQGE